MIRIVVVEVETCFECPFLWHIETDEDIGAYPGDTRTYVHREFMCGKTGSSVSIENHKIIDDCPLPSKKD